MVDSVDTYLAIRWNDKSITAELNELLHLEARLRNAQPTSPYSIECTHWGLCGLLITRKAAGSLNHDGRVALSIRDLKACHPAESRSKMFYEKLHSQPGAIRSFCGAVSGSGDRHELKRLPGAL